MNTRFWMLWAAGMLLHVEFTCALTPDWIRQMGTTTRDALGGVAADAMGNAYVAGSTSGDLFASNAGWDDAYLAKIDAKGNLEWGWQAGSGSSDAADVVVADPNGDVLIGGKVESSSEYIFFRKLHSDGALMWEERHEGSARLYGVDVDGAGDFYFTGFGQGVFGPEPGTAFLGRHSSSGSLLWTQNINSMAFLEQPKSIAVDLAGNNYVFWNAWDPSANEYLVERFDAGGDREWTVSLTTVYGDNFWPFDIICDAYGNLYIAGGWVSEGNVLHDSFLTKYSPSSDVNWTTPLPFGAVPSNIRLSTSSIAYVNQVIDESTLQVTAIDTAEGSVRWTDAWDSGAEVFGDTRLKPRIDVTALDDGADTMYVAIQTVGSLGSPNLGDYDIYLAKFTLPTLLDGDFDSDGDVDGADLLAWQRGASPTPLSADDFATWQAVFGAANEPVAPAGVPEPATLVAALAAVLAGAQRRQGRTRSASARFWETRS